MSDKKNEAHGIVQRHILYAMGVGTIPIPMVDVTAVVAVQLDMIRQIAKHYGQKYDENMGKAFIASLTSTSLARIGASMIKALPGIGTIIGGFSMAIASGASTYALGNVIITFMENGIDLGDIDKGLAKEMYEEELEEGKKVATELKKKQATKETPKATEKSATAPKKEDDIYTQLSKLGELRDKNIITADEFEKMKKDIIDKF